MALSADEQRLLDQLEASLRAEDPGFSRKFEVAPEPVVSRRPWWALIVGFAAGIVLLAAGMLWWFPLSVLGFLVMFGGVVFVIVRSPHAAKSADPQDVEADPKTRTRS